MAAKAFRPSHIRTAADVLSLVSQERPAGSTSSAVYLDGAGRVLSIVSAADQRLCPRETLRKAVALGSIAMVIAEVTEEAKPRPGQSHLTCCAEIGQAARSLGIKLLDYLLFGTDDFCSFRAAGLM